MLSKFIYNDCYKKIPCTGFIYEIDPKGNIRQSFTKEHIAHYKGDDGVVRVSTGYGEWFDGMSVAVLLSIVHRNVTLPIQVLPKLEVLYKDGNLENITPYNTVLKCPEGNLGHPAFPGFCYVPGASRYLINIKGELLSPIKGELLSPYQDANGYWMFGVQPDVGPRTIVGQHRLLALAWLTYPANVDKLDVNHLNTDTSDNDISNLEWATRSRNNFHAHEHGLSNSIPVLVRDIYTGKVSRFYSFEEAGRALDSDSSVVAWRCNAGKDGRVYDGLQYKLETDKTPWAIFANPNEYTLAPMKRRIKVLNSSTGEQREFESMNKACEFLNVKSGTMSYNLCRRETFVVKEFIASYA